MAEDTIRVSLSMQFSLLDRSALAAHLAPVLEAAIAAGGNQTSLFIYPDDEETDE